VTYVMRMRLPYKKTDLIKLKENKLCGDFTIKMHCSLSHKSQWIGIYIFYINIQFGPWSFFCTIEPF